MIFEALHVDRFVEINSPNAAVLHDPSQPRYLNDITTGKYDVAVSTGPSFQTRRQEASEGMIAFVFDFDDTINQVLMFQRFMPRDYDGNGIDTNSAVGASSATSGNLSWKLFLMSITSDADDIDTKNFAAPNSNQAVDAPSASGEFVNCQIQFSDGADMDSIAKGEWFYGVLMRDAQDATNDDMSGDAEFQGMEIRETR